MLTIRDQSKTRPWEVPPRKEGNTPRVKEAAPKPNSLHLDEVVLQTRVKIVVSEEEYLVATYWG